MKHKYSLWKIFKKKIEVFGSVVVKLIKPVLCITFCLYDIKKFSGFVFMYFTKVSVNALIFCFSFTVIDFAVEEFINTRQGKINEVVDVCEDWVG